MKTKHLLTIAAILGLSLVPALPSHSQPNNPCKLAPFSPPSKETRQIRVEKYGIAFNIPENYRTRSNISDIKIGIRLYDPSGFDYYECLVRNKVSTDEDPVIAIVSVDKVNTSTSLTELIDSSYNRVRVGRVAKIIRNLTFANQPAVILQYRDGLYREWIGLIFLSSSKKYLVDISYGMGFLSKETQNSAEKVAETIKSSFTFDLSSSPYSVTTSSSVSQASNNPANKLLNGVYVGEGTMFNNSHREVLSRNNRTCIKFVDGPASPYSGRQEITISSLSLRAGKLFTDSYTSYANGTELEAFAGEDLNPPYSTFLYKDVKAAFRHAERTYWVYRGKTLRNINPEMDKDLQECVTSQGVYKKTRKGAVIDGIKPSW